MKTWPISTVARKSIGIRQPSFRPQCRSFSDASITSLVNNRNCSNSRLTLPSTTQAYRLCLRYASTQAAEPTPLAYRSRAEAFAAPKPPTFSPKILAKLNPPSFTYAPEIDLSEQEDKESKLKFLWRRGRAYLKFYKQGILNVRATAKLAKTLRRKRDNAPPERRDTVLTRAEWQVVRRSRKDILRLPLFGLLVLVFGEWLPLFVLFLTPIVPEPCRIPAQVERAQRKLEKAREIREQRLFIFQKYANEDGKDDLRILLLAKPHDIDLKDLETADRVHLLALSTELSCHPKWRDWLPTAGYLRRVVRKRMEYLHMDNALITRDGGWPALSYEEMLRACVERGIAIEGRSNAEMMEDLSKWFQK